MPQKTPKPNSNIVLPKLTLILAKIAEVLHWILASAMLLATLVTIIQPASFIEWVKNASLRNSPILSCYGFDASIVDANGNVRLGMTLFFTIGSAIVLLLVAMIFRNIYLILKTAEGKTWFAKGNTPFQKNIVRMFREIGIFFITISIMSLISEIIIKLTGEELINGLNYISCFIGLVFLCISQFFNYGTKLEKDLDGLV